MCPRQFRRGACARGHGWLSAWRDVGGEQRGERRLVLTVPVPGRR